MAEIKIMNLAAMQRYDEKMKAFLAEADTKVLADANAYAESLADNYDAAGTAATKVQELAEGAVAANAVGVAENKAAIEKLNGDASTEGSVAKAVADAKALVDADVDAVEAKADANAANITTIQGEMDVVEAKAQANADEITGLKSRMDTAEGDITAIEADMGNVDELETTNKELVKAINEVREAVGTGGTNAIVTVTAKGATDDYANVYEITQGGSVVGTINIPKDLVVESGRVVVNPEGQAEGTYIELKLANVEVPLYINVGTLVDIYKAKAEATQVQVEINSDNREISAYIVAGSVGTAELADGSVTTVKIADANVTKAKLSTEVQASLDKADVAEDNAKAYADDMNGVMDVRVAAVEAKLGTGEGSVEDLIATAKAEAISTAAADATAKADAAEADANKYTDEKIAENKALIDANVSDISGLKTRMDESEADIAALETSLAEGGATANAIAAAKKAGDNAQADVDALTERVATNEASIGAHADRLTALEDKVGDGFVEITTEEIDAMFA